MTDHAQQDAAARAIARASDDQAADAARLREALADAAHTAWSGWMAYLFGRTVDLASHVSDAMFTIAPSDAERWKRQMRTPYAALSEAEKESDRAEADKILAVLARHRQDLQQTPQDVHPAWRDVPPPGPPNPITEGGWPDGG